MEEDRTTLVAAVGALTCQLPSTPSSQPVKRRTTSSSSTATRLTRNSLHKLRRINEDAAPAATASTFQSPTPRAFHVHDLNQRIKHLFPDPQVLALPCTSARLFAYFSLVAESSANQVVVEDTPRRSTRRQTTRGSVVEPILRHLTSLVQAEVASLQACGESDHRPRRITFCGFDCSSTKPPVDRVDGSGQHQSHAIQALRHAKESLDFLTNETENQNRAIQCLDRLQHFLQTTLSSSATEDQSMCQMCAESISRHYPPKRLFQAMRIYINEIKGTVWRLRGQSSELFIEDHLSSLLCRRIRYHLRLLLNPAPPRLTPRDVDYSQRSKGYSQIHTHVEMLVDGPKNTVYEVDGERLASLFNAALSQVANYFGVENLLDTSYEIPPISSNFCSSEASRRQIPIRSKIPLPPLTLTQIEDVQADMDEAFRVLVVGNACQFLVDLLAIPNVQSELKRQGGWGEVETHASLLWRYEIWGIHHEEAHLVLLCNVTTFSNRLVTLAAALQGPRETARVCLTDMGARFRVTTKSAELRRTYPEIITLGDHLREWWEQALTVPSVQAK